MTAERDPRDIAALELVRQLEASEAEVERLIGERDALAVLLREWLAHAEPQFHRLAEDDPAGTFCNECGGEMPCYMLRTAALLGSPPEIEDSDRRYESARDVRVSESETGER